LTTVSAEPAGRRERGIIWSACGVAAVDGEGGSGDVCRLVGGQEADGAAMSSGRASRPSGIAAVTDRSVSAGSSCCASQASYKGVWVMPGAMALTRMFRGASSTAAAVVRAASAPLVAL